MEVQNIVISAPTPSPPPHDHLSTIRTAHRPSLYSLTQAYWWTITIIVFIIRSVYYPFCVLFLLPCFSPALCSSSSISDPSLPSPPPPPQSPSKSRSRTRPGNRLIHRLSSALSDFRGLDKYLLKLLETSEHQAAVTILQLQHQQAAIERYDKAITKRKKTIKWIDEMRGKIGMQLEEGEILDGVREVRKEVEKWVTVCVANGGGSGENGDSEEMGLEEEMEKRMELEKKVWEILVRGVFACTVFGMPGHLQRYWTLLEGAMREQRKSYPSIYQCLPNPASFSVWDIVPAVRC